MSAAFEKLNRLSVRPSTLFVATVTCNSKTYFLLMQFLFLFFFFYFFQYFYCLISPLFLYRNWPSYHCGTRRHIVADLGKTLKWKKNESEKGAFETWYTKHGRFRGSCYCLPSFVTFILFALFESSHKILQQLSFCFVCWVQMSVQTSITSIKAVAYLHRRPHCSDCCWNQIRRCQIQVVAKYLKILIVCKLY